MGRPVKEDAKRKNLHIRLSEKEIAALKRVSKHLHMNRSDAIRTLVENYEKKEME